MIQLACSTAGCQNLRSTMHRHLCMSCLIARSATKTPRTDAPRARIAAARCAWCNALATTRDEDGDPACEKCATPLGQVAS